MPWRQRLIRVPARRDKGLNDDGDEGEGDGNVGDTVGLRSTGRQGKEINSAANRGILVNMGQGWLTSIKATNSPWDRVIVQMPIFFGSSAIIRVWVMVYSTLRQETRF